MSKDSWLEQRPVPLPHQMMCFAYQTLCVSPFG